MKGTNPRVNYIQTFNYFQSLHSPFYTHKTNNNHITLIFNIIWKRGEDKRTPNQQIKVIKSIEPGFKVEKWMNVMVHL